MTLRKSILMFFMVIAAAALFSDGIDGVIGDSEYTNVHDSGQMKLYSRLDNSVLSVAVEAPTNGWVAAGFGSLRMDGAYIVMGYVKKDGPHISQVEGSGHRLKEPAAVLVSQWAAVEEGDTTVLEFSVPVESLKTKTSGNGIAIDMIMSYSNTDVTWMKHSYRTSFTLELK